MKAVLVHQFTPFDQARYGECPDPVPSRDEVVVDIEAVDVNFPDSLQIEGKYQNSPAFPFSPGMGGAGRVSRLGEAVDKLQLGQKVLVLPSHGTYAQKVAAPARYCFPIPDDVPCITAAALGLVYQTAYFALTDRAALGAGETVLVLGSGGGIGMATMQLAKALGAGRVIATARGSQGRAFAEQAGADIVIDYTGENLRDALRDAVGEATQGRGADVVIDPVGGNLSAAALRAMAWRGRMVVVGFASGDIPKIGANYLLVKNIGVSGIQWTDYRERQLDRVRAAQEHIFSLWRAGRIAPAITRTLPLSRFGEALDAVLHGHAKGKIILTTQDQ
ncbi:NADPH:quinone oxidoreductase family protein [Devosia sp. A369]